MGLKSKIKRWYLGGPLPTKEVNSPTSTTHRAPNTFEPSNSARCAQWCVKHLMPIIATLVAAIVALFIHFDGKSASQPEQEKTESIGEKVIQNESPK